MEYQHENVDTNAGVARNADDEHNKDDTVMKERPKKKEKRGPYQKIEPQTIIAAMTNVMRRGYDVEQASIAAQNQASHFTVRNSSIPYIVGDASSPSANQGQPPQEDPSNQAKTPINEDTDMAEALQDGQTPQGNNGTQASRYASPLSIEDQADMLPKKVEDTMKERFLQDNPSSTVRKLRKKRHEEALEDWKAFTATQQALNPTWVNEKIGDHISMQSFRIVMCSDFRVGCPIYTFRPQKSNGVTATNLRRTSRE
ncbi:predicted protein [Lichtheimia corymbifera JMRC:FSU:9682]|uniref:Uncharacterized protein n=1 Tax=Lichtheimia corymbifera JMRC:FSU:9682 TaxID=1263082 RepID=A0A068SFL2_9FUNG|nr:predicted protein [Lichtheimia corymbifera JMRC:FSU:9682]